MHICSCSSINQLDGKWARGEEGNDGEREGGQGEKGHYYSGEVIIV